MKLGYAAVALATFSIACASTQKSDPPPPAPAPAPQKPAGPPKDPDKAKVAIVGLSDFHGWLLPLEPKGFPNYYGGIANIAGFLKHRDKLTDENTLILDNGDMWTGPTESTFLRGESVIKAYNELGVDAANVANHEFDFGVEILKTRIEEAKFPFLGANIVEVGTGKQPAFVKPWIILERDGVKIGVLGLSYRDTPKTTHAKHVAGLEFRDYAEVLKVQVPALRSAGAEVVVVLFHETVDVITEVMKGLPGLGVNAIIAGQNHRKGSAEVEGTLIVNPGPFGRSYVRFDVEVDRKSKAPKLSFEIVDVTGEIGSPSIAPDLTLLGVAQSAREKAQQLSGEAVGQLAAPLPIGSFADSPVGNFITDAWLRAFPDADGAICNHGAFRQPLPQGTVTIGDIVGVLPFENNLYILKLTGKQLKAQLEIDGPSVGGITFKYKEAGGKRTVVSIADKNGKPVEDGKVYRILINDFMYTGGDGFTFKDVDPTPEDTGLSMREPLLRELRAAQQSGTPYVVKKGARATLAK